MKKNVSGQKIGAQLVDASDGSAFTGSVTVYVTGDAGTQAAGSVGSGACVHEGNGYHTYAPSQAETNYDLVAFTFVGTGAVPATVQVYTSFPQSVDNATGIAAIKAVTDVLPDAGALTSIATAAALATVDSNVDAILIDTAEIGTAGAGLTVLATQSLLTTVAGYLDTEIAAIKAKTDNLPASPAAVGDIPTAGAVADAVWDEAIAGHAGSGSTGEALGAAGASGDPWITALPGSYTAGQAGYIVGTNLDAAVSSISAGSGLDAAGVRAAIGLASANLDDQLDALPTAGENADAVWDEALSGHTTSGTAGKAAIDTDLRGSRTVIRGTVAGSASTTSLPTSAFSPGGASADQFKGRIVIFDNDTTTAALRGEATDITASTNSATPTLTVTALSATPASGDTFSVV